MSVPLSNTRLAEALSSEREAGIRQARAICGRTGAYSADMIDDLLAEITRLRAQLATEPAQPSPEHQAIYLDDFDQVWCDYPTVPAGDDVLPLVWASEQAQSRSDLADGGNRLRVIGWCR